MNTHMVLKHCLLVKNRDSAEKLRLIVLLAQPLSPWVGTISVQKNVNKIGALLPYDHKTEALSHIGPSAYQSVACFALCEPDFYARSRLFRAVSCSIWSKWC